MADLTDSAGVQAPVPTTHAYHANRHPNGYWCPQCVGPASAAGVLGTSNDPQAHVSAASPLDSPMEGDAGGGEASQAPTYEELAAVIRAAAAAAFPRADIAAMAERLRADGVPGTFNAEEKKHG